MVLACPSSRSARNNSNNEDRGGNDPSVDSEGLPRAATDRRFVPAGHVKFGWRAAAVRFCPEGEAGGTAGAAATWWCFPTATGLKSSAATCNSW